MTQKLDDAAQGSVDRELLQRLAAGFTLGPVGFLAIWFGGSFLSVAASVCGVAMFWEWRRMTTGHSGIVALVLGGTGIVLACVLALTSLAFTALTLVVTIGAVTVADALSKQRKLIHWAPIGLLYTGLPAISLIVLRSDLPNGQIVAISTLLIVWITDIGGYFAGRGFGGPRLAPRGSPNKTWSGAVGALILATLVGASVASFTSAPLLLWMSFAIVVSLVAQGGDLLESYFKRYFGVKDSSKLIPGHGGALDRLDSLGAVSVVLAGVVLTAPTLLSDL